MEILARSVGVQVLALFQILTTSQVPALPQILVSSRDASLEYL